MSEAPTLEEFEKMIRKAPNDKGLNGDHIPIELMKNSSQARVMVWKMVKARDMMKLSTPGEKLEIPNDLV